MVATAKRPRAVLVDLDGTMVDSVPDIAAAANRMLAQLGAPPLPLQTVRSFIGWGVAHLVRQVLAHAPGVGPADEAGALAIFERHYIDCNGRHSTVFAGVQQGLAMLRGLGYALACVTNKPRPYTEPLLDALGLSPCFDTVACGEPALPLKPHPALLLAACSRLGVQPAQCVMVGDSGVDASAADRAGMPVYLVRYGYRNAAAPDAAPCNGYIDALDELPALLGQAGAAVSASG
ncbi:phosphoglycolate phosphatase [Noviherbaspirillum soli]|uniref:phosphoglycolate phosphatase n=1 Tax=Noviherbaspirillum soli TaxID=1064518 RepID=UPI00188D7E9E|nr:phosphoglycolate phosphatase [Noviherbaspirillum soli]